ncbi:MAG: hypothetical protein WD492_12910 [Alkalispirochaeta sp.]
MIYRLLDRLHTRASCRLVNRLARDLDELTAGDREQKIAHHAGEFMSLVEVEATESGNVVDNVLIVPDEEEGYRYSVQHKDVEVDT